MLFPIHPRTYVKTLNLLQLLNLSRVLFGMCHLIAIRSFVSQAEWNRLNDRYPTEPTNNVMVDTVISGFLIHLVLATLIEVFDRAFNPLDQEVEHLNQNHH